MAGRRSCTEWNLRDPLVHLFQFSAVEWFLRVSLIWKVATCPGHFQSNLTWSRFCDIRAFSIRDWSLKARCRTGKISPFPARESSFRVRPIRKYGNASRLPNASMPRRRTQQMESGPSASAGSVRKVAETVFLVAQNQELDTLVSSHVAGRMNKRTGTILGGTFVVLLALGSFAWRPPARPKDPVVLRLKGYHWVARQDLCYAQLELVNRSTNAVSYPVFQDDLLRLSPTFTRTDQWPGWEFRTTSSSPPGTVSEMHTLAPGKTVTLRVEVKRGGPKPSIGILC